MKSKTKLILIKILHTVIWLFYAMTILYTLYAAIVDKIDAYFWMAVGFVVLEGIILLIYGGHCPITLISEKYSRNVSVGFDIFIPKWIARYNKMIFGTIFLVSIIIAAYRFLT